MGIHFINHTFPRGGWGGGGRSPTRSTAERSADICIYLYILRELCFRWFASSAWVVCIFLSGESHLLLGWFASSAFLALTFS